MSVAASSAAAVSPSERAPHVELDGRTRGHVNALALATADRDRLRQNPPNVFEVDDKAFWNAGDESARILELISPAGFENYFREQAPLLAAADRDRVAINRVAARYGLEIDFGTVPVLIERYQLRSS